MSAVETGQMSAAETRQMPAVETRQMSTIETGLCPVSILYIYLVSTADICPVSAAEICPVSADPFLLHQRCTKRNKPGGAGEGGVATEMQPRAAGRNPLHTRRGKGLREFLNKLAQSKFETFKPDLLR